MYGLGCQGFGVVQIITFPNILHGRKPIQVGPVGRRTRKDNILLVNV